MNVHETAKIEGNIYDEVNRDKNIENTGIYRRIGIRLTEAEQTEENN